jgi:hypothetical protein
VESYEADLLPSLPLAELVSYSDTDIALYQQVLSYMIVPVVEVQKCFFCWRMDVSAYLGWRLYDVMFGGTVCKDIRRGVHYWNITTLYDRTYGARYLGCK